ncbi:hypothetical protein AK812_SmicGene38509, partial [Symbiodinium microadriaticum]
MKISCLTRLALNVGLNYKHWTKRTFQKLQRSRPDSLSSQFRLSMAQVLSVVAGARQRGTDGALLRHGESELEDLIAAAQCSRGAQRFWRRQARAYLSALEGEGVEQKLSEEEEEGDEVGRSLPADDATLFVTEAMAVFRQRLPEEDLPLAALAAAEAVCDAPQTLLRAAGEADPESSTGLRPSQCPEALEDLLFQVFNEFRTRRPWLAAGFLRPKGIALDLVLCERSFGALARRLSGAAVTSEGNLLRYLADVYRILRLADIADPNVRAVQVDSSLIREWEALKDMEKKAAKEQQEAILAAATSGVEEVSEPEEEKLVGGAMVPAARSSAPRRTAEELRERAKEVQRALAFRHEQAEAMTEAPGPTQCLLLSMPYAEEKVAQSVSYGRAAFEDGGDGRGVECCQCRHAWCGQASAMLRCSRANFQEFFLPRTLPGLRRGPGLLAELWVAERIFEALSYLKGTGCSEGRLQELEACFGKTGDFTVVVEQAVDIGGKSAKFKVAALADKCQIDLLHAVCVAAIRESLTPTAACAILTCADRFHVESPHQDSLCIIFAHPCDSLSSFPALNARLRQVGQGESVMGWANWPPTSLQQVMNLYGGTRRFLIVNVPLLFVGLGANLLGSFSALLSLDAFTPLVRSLRLDGVYAVRGLKRHYIDGLSCTFTYPGDWVYDASLEISRYRRQEKTLTLGGGRNTGAPLPLVAVCPQETSDASVALYAVPAAGATMSQALGSPEQAQSTAGVRRQGRPREDMEPRPEPEPAGTQMKEAGSTARLAEWRRADTIGSGLLATWSVEGLWWDLVLKVQVREAPLKKNILLKNNWRSGGGSKPAGTPAGKKPRVVVASTRVRFDDHDGTKEIADFLGCRLSSIAKTLKRSAAKTVRRLNDELVVPAGATSVATVAMQGGAVLPEQERLKREEHLAAVPAAISIIQERVTAHLYLQCRLPYHIRMEIGDYLSNAFTWSGRWSGRFNYDATLQLQVHNRELKLEELARVLVTFAPDDDWEEKMLTVPGPRGGELRLRIEMQPRETVWSLWLPDAFKVAEQQWQTWRAANLTKATMNPECIDLVASDGYCVGHLLDDGSLQLHVHNRELKLE